MSCFRSSAPTARNFSCAWKKGWARFRRGAPPFKKPPPGGVLPHEPVFEAEKMGLRSFLRLLLSASSHLRMRLHVTLMAECPQVVRVEHQLLLLPQRETFFHRAYVMHLGSRSEPAFFPAPLAQRKGCQLCASQPYPLCGVYESSVVLVLCHSLVGLKMIVTSRDCASTSVSVFQWSLVCRWLVSCETLSVLFRRIA